MRCWSHELHTNIKYLKTHLDLFQAQCVLCLVVSMRLNKCKPDSYLVENAAGRECISFYRHNNILKALTCSQLKCAQKRGREAKGAHLQNNKDKVSNRSSSTC